MNQFSQYCIFYCHTTDWMQLSHLGTTISFEVTNGRSKKMTCVKEYCNVLTKAFLLQSSSLPSIAIDKFKELILSDFQRKVLMSTRLATAPQSGGLTQPSQLSSRLSTTSTGVETIPSAGEEPYPGMLSVPGSHLHLLACLPHPPLTLILWTPQNPSTTPTTTLSLSPQGK